WRTLMVATRVGFVGLGKMGCEMASHLVRAGFAVQGYDVSPSAAAAFEQRGGKTVDSPVEAARGAQILAIMVHTAEQADSVLFGEGRAAEALPRGATVLLHPTVSPTYVSSLAQRLAVTEHLLLDAPVVGGASGAAEG